MTKFKVGDRVKMKIGPMVDTVVDLVGDGVLNLKEYGFSMVYNWELIDKTLDNLEVGDVVLDSSRDERCILAVCDKLVAVSNWSDITELDSWYSVDQLKKYGYTIKQETPKDEPLEVTMDEIAEKFGVDVKNLKVKKSK